MRIFPHYHFKNPFKRGCIAFIDLLGVLCLFPIRSGKRDSKSLQEIKKILLVRIDHLGDVLLILPAIREIQSKFKNAHIDLLTTPEACLLLKNRVSFNLIPFHQNWFNSGSSLFQKVKEAAQLRKTFVDQKYDVAVDFRGDFRTILLLWLSKIKRRLG